MVETLENNSLGVEKRKREDNIDEFECRKAKIHDKLKDAVTKHQKASGKFKVHLS